MAKITDTLIRNLKGTKGETHVERCGGGLELWVTINQANQTSKKWVLRYYDAGGKRQKARIGTYPDLTLAKAVALAEDLKAQAKEGINIAKEKEKIRKEKIIGVHEEQQNTFEAVARQWLAKNINWSASHAKRQRERLEANVFPIFGHKSIKSISMPDIDSAMMLVVNRGVLDAAQRITTIVKSIFEYADSMGYIEDISIITRLSSYKKKLPKPKKDRHYYKDVTEGQIGKLLHDLKASKGRWTLQTSVAIRLAPYVFVRPGELCEAEWCEFNLEAAEWYIPARRMKAGQDHIVPLSRQALALIYEIKAFSGNSKYLFPSWSRKNIPITTNALVGVLRKLGYSSTLKNPDSAFTTHGFRGMASTILYQKLGYPGDYVELQLAHKEKDKIKAAYNHVTPRSYLDERRKMMQDYADYLDKLRSQYEQSLS